MLTLTGMFDIWQVCAGPGPGASGKPVIRGSGVSNEAVVGHLDERTVGAPGGLALTGRPVLSIASLPVWVLTVLSVHQGCSGM
jgi:hypothetical protein